MSFVHSWKAVVSMMPLLAASLDMRSLCKGVWCLKRMASLALSQFATPLEIKKSQRRVHSPCISGPSLGVQETSPHSLELCDKNKSVKPHITFPRHPGNSSLLAQHSQETSFLKEKGGYCCFHHQISLLHPYITMAPGGTHHHLLHGFMLDLDLHDQDFSSLAIPCFPPSFGAMKADGT